ncbi:hypothetical protein GEV33_005301 [Tenebrio molitor]|uniref:Uncharacterized protein n=1 Tax=Tenebrio molitor TaxID=7067 RepID=A0A8J6LDY3_TENMO|nr:hypothetical protein GEV33_005301 [Tenebrio molitor]
MFEITGRDRSYNNFDAGVKKGSVPALAALEQRGEVGIVATQSAIGLGRRPDCLYRSGRGGVKGHMAAWLAGCPEIIDNPSPQFCPRTKRLGQEGFCTPDARLMMTFRRTIQNRHPPRPQTRFLPQRRRREFFESNGKPQLFGREPEKRCTFVATAAAAARQTTDKSRRTRGPSSYKLHKTIIASNVSERNRCARRVTMATERGGNVRLCGASVNKRPHPKIPPSPIARAPLSLEKPSRFTAAEILHHNPQKCDHFQRYPPQFWCAAWVLPATLTRKYYSKSIKRWDLREAPELQHSQISSPPAASASINQPFRNVDVSDATATKVVDPGAKGWQEIFAKTPEDSRSFWRESKPDVTSAQPVGSPQKGQR